MSPTVKVEIKTNLRNATGNSTSKYCLDQAAIVPRGGDSVFICATDGRQLSVAACDGFSNGFKFVPSNALPKGKRGGVVEFDEQWKTTTGTRTKTTTITDSVRQTKQFPTVQDVIPDTDPNCLALKLNVATLAKLANAISRNDEVTLLINSEDSAIGILADRGIGVVMPLTQGNKLDAVAEYGLHRAEFKRCLTTRVNRRR